MSTINVGSLPVIDELFEDDMVLVQAKDRTGLLKFSDLVVGEQQVSFYQEIVNARNSIAGVSQAVQQNTTSISTNAQLIEDLQDKTNDNSAAIQTIQGTTTSLQDQTTNLQSSVSAVATLANSVLNESVERLSQSTASNQQLSTQYSTLTGNISDSLASMDQRILDVEQQVEQLYTVINNINSTLYSQQEQINDLKNGSGSSSTGDGAAGDGAAGDGAAGDGAAGDGAAGDGAAEDNKEWYEYLGTHESSLISNLIDTGMIDTSTRAAKHVRDLSGTMLDDSALVLQAADASIFTTEYKDAINLQWYFVGASTIFDDWLTTMRVKADAAIAAEAAAEAAAAEAAAAAEEAAAAETGNRYQVLPHETGADHWMGGHGAGVGGEFNFRLGFFDSQTNSIVSAYDLCVAEGYIDNTQPYDAWTSAAVAAGIVDQPHWFYHSELKALQNQIYDRVIEIFLSKPIGDS